MDKLGWVKLHRQLLNNKFLRRDKTAFFLFINLLLMTDRDGTLTTGRYRLAEIVDLKPTTAYGVLKRLEKAKMVTLISNNKFTIVSICNWSKFQQRTDTTGDIKLTSNRHQTDTITRIEEYKELKKSNTNVLLSNVSDEDQRLTNLLYELVRENYPNIKPKVEIKAAQEMERLHRIDAYPYDVIEAVIRWSQQDEFWKQNIRSVTKLRKQFDTLLIKATGHKQKVVEI